MKKTPILVSMFLFLLFIGTCIPVPQPAPVPQRDSCDGVPRWVGKETCYECSLFLGCSKCCDDDGNCIDCDHWSGTCWTCCRTDSVWNDHPCNDCGGDTGKICPYRK